MKARKYNYIRDLEEKISNLKHSINRDNNGHNNSLSNIKNNDELVYINNDLLNINNILKNRNINLTQEYNNLLMKFNESKQLNGSNYEEKEYFINKINELSTENKILVDKYDNLKSKIELNQTDSY